MDGDGRPDLIVGADSENPDGRVYVFSGAAVDLTAVSLSPATLSPGDTFRFRFAVENQTGETLRGAVRAEVRDADGKVLLEPMTISTATLGSTDTLAVEAEQRVPRATAAGLYRYVLTAESNAGVLADVETLEITVTGGTSPSASAAWPRPTVSALADGAVVAVPKVAASAEAAVGVEAFPNPFSSRTTLRFSLDGATEARLAVYDVLGREVAVLHDGYAEAGIHDAVFEADGLATGMYVWRLVAGSRVETGSLTLVR